MTVRLAILNCKQLVTLAGPARPRVGLEMRELSIIEDGAMLVRQDRIERVGARNESFAAGFAGLRLPSDCHGFQGEKNPHGGGQLGQAN